MNNVQLYFAIGVPTLSVLIGIVIGIFQQVHTLNQFNLRFTSLENRIGSVEGRVGSIENRLDARMSTIEADIKILVRILGDMDTRIARLEERIAR